MMPSRAVGGGARFAKRPRPGTPPKTPLIFRFSKTVPNGVPCHTMQVVAPDPMIDALSDRAAELGVTRSKLVFDVLATWLQAVRDYELEYGFDPVEAHERPPVIEPFDGYGKRLVRFGSPSSLDSGLEAL
jgi:hypothetical protein